MYYNKYLKYKRKYLQLKQFGGSSIPDEEKKDEEKCKQSVNKALENKSLENKSLHMKMIRLVEFSKKSKDNFKECLKNNNNNLDEVEIRKYFDRKVFEIWKKAKEEKDSNLTKINDDYDKYFENRDNEKIIAKRDGEQKLSDKVSPLLKDKYSDYLCQKVNEFNEEIDKTKFKVTLLEFKEELVPPSDEDGYFEKVPNIVNQLVETNQKYNKENVKLHYRCKQRTLEEKKNIIIRELEEEKKKEIRELDEELHKEADDFDKKKKIYTSEETINKFESEQKEKYFSSINKIEEKYRILFNSIYEQ